MRTAEDVSLASSVPLETLRTVLQEYPVQLAILFGSHATETTHSRSDLDIAVHFDEITPVEPTYNDVFFGLSAALSEELAEDVDLVDLQRCSPTMVRSIFEHGVLLVGDQEDVSTIRQRLTPDESTDQSPRERLDSSIAKINAHLDDTAVPATDSPRRDR